MTAKEGYQRTQRHALPRRVPGKFAKKRIEELQKGAFDRLVTDLPV